MKKLRHPNILLFMGVVTSPQRLCIVTEFLPRFVLDYYFWFKLFCFYASKRSIVHRLIEVSGTYKKQWKFVSFTTEEHRQIRLETPCSYGFGHCEFFHTFHNFLF